MTGQETEDDESIGVPLSSQILTVSEDDHINDKNEGEEEGVELPLDPPDKSESVTESEIASNERLKSKPSDSIVEESHPPQSAEIVKEQEYKSLENNSSASLNDFPKKLAVKKESSTDTDTPLGHPRHRPPKQPHKTSDGGIELTATTDPTHDRNGKKVPLAETTFTVDSEDSLMAANTLSVSSPSHSPRMTLPNFPKDKTTDGPRDTKTTGPLSSPRALKNLNILSRSSSMNGRTRRSSTGSRASSTVSDVLMR